MNFITANIYNPENQVDSLLSTSVQLAIIQQVNRLVNKQYPQVHSSSWVSVAGQLMLTEQANYLLRLAESPLLETIYHWNDKHNTNQVPLDGKTIKLARAIEDVFSTKEQQTDRSLTQALIAAEIPTECEHSVATLGEQADSNVEVLFDSVTGKSTYITSSRLGYAIHRQLIQSFCADHGHPEIHIIQAPQGAGKTRFLSKLITSTATTGAVRTTCVSPRQQLVSSMFTSLAQTSTIDPDQILVGTSANVPYATKKQDQRPSDEYPVAVTTINSMERIWKFTAELARQSKKLERDFSHNLITDDEYDERTAKLLAGGESGNIFNLIPNYDLVIYDEFQLLRNTIIEGTHIDTDQAFWIRRHLHRLESGAKAVVVLDADIDNTVVDYFATNHPNSKIHLHRFILPEQREIHIHTDSASIECWLYNEIKSVPAKAPNINHVPASFAIPCASASKGRKIEQTIRSLRPDLNIIWIESKNAHLPEQRELLDDTSLAFKYDVIIYSPKIFTGFSFDSIEVDGQRIPVAERVVGMFGNRRINWMERAQSLFRVRDCKEIHFSLSSVEETESAPISSETRLERTRLFELGAMPTPTPMYEYENDNMVPYFRSRGFHIVDHQQINNATELVTEIVAHVPKVEPTVEPVELKREYAQQFVDRLLQSLKVDTKSLTVGEHHIFTGRLCEDFSLHIDRILTEYPSMVTGIRLLNPNWKRNKRYDIKLAQKMFSATGDQLSLVSSCRSTRTSFKGNRIPMYSLTLAIKS